MRKSRLAFHGHLKRISVKTIISTWDMENSYPLAEISVHWSKWRMDKSSRYLFTRELFSGSCEDACETAEHLCRGTTEKESVVEEPLTWM